METTAVGTEKDEVFRFRMKARVREWRNTMDSAYSPLDSEDKEDIRIHVFHALVDANPLCTTEDVKEILSTPEALRNFLPLTDPYPAGFLRWMYEEWIEWNSNPENCSEVEPKIKEARAFFCPQHQFCEHVDQGPVSKSILDRPRFAKREYREHVVPFFDFNIQPCSYPTYQKRTRKMQSRRKLMDVPPCFNENKLMRDAFFYTSFDRVPSIQGIRDMLLSPEALRNHISLHRGRNRDWDFHFDLLEIWLNWWTDPEYKDGFERYIKDVRAFFGA